MTILEPVYNFVWFILYTIVHNTSLIFEVIQIKLRYGLKSVTYSRNSSCTNVEDIAKFSKSLPKLPKHLAISLTLDKGGEPEVDINALAQLLSWAWAAQIQVISLYDHSGHIKRRSHKLKQVLETEIKNHWATKVSPELPSQVQFHNTSTPIENNPKAINVRNAFHVIMFSNADGKSRIINTVKEMSGKNPDYTDLNKENNQINSKPQLIENLEAEDSDSDELTEARLDTLLALAQNYKWIKDIGISMEPDLLVILSNIRSTLGFLPWHIRLTEIHWIPTLPNIVLKDFMNALQGFAGCEQREGK